MSFQELVKNKQKYIYIYNKIQDLKIANEFKFISQNHRLFQNVIENIIETIVLDDFLENW